MKRARHGRTCAGHSEADDRQCKPFAQAALDIKVAAKHAGSPAMHIVDVGAREVVRATLATAAGMLKLRSQPSKDSQRRRGCWQAGCQPLASHRHSSAARRVDLSCRLRLCGGTQTDASARADGKDLRRVIC